MSLQTLIPELLLSIATFLPTSSLAASIQTCRHLHKTLQSTLDALITPEEGQKILSWACEKSRAVIVEKMLSQYKIHPDLGQGQYSWIKMPLHSAAEKGSVEIVRMLLDAGARLAPEWDQEEDQPLHLAVCAGHTDVVRLLLERGAPPNDFCGCDGIHNSTLQLAVGRARDSEEIAELLLAHGANINKSGSSGPPLAWAVRARNVARVKWILERGGHAEAEVDLYGSMLEGTVTPPRDVNVLYLCLSLPSTYGIHRRRHAKEKGKKVEYDRWIEPEQTKEVRREIMAVLMENGASKSKTMQIVRDAAEFIAEAAGQSQEEIIEYVEGIFRDVEERFMKKDTEKGKDTGTTGAE